MRRMRIWRLWMCLALGLCSGLAAEEDGYFLTWRQKKELLNLGRIQDSEGTWYDIWICPGYAPPCEFAGTHARQAGRDFREYIEADKYRALRRGSATCVRWALRQCGQEFVVRGVPRAWRKYFAAAQERTARRVFGWWLAYPWAALEATVDTAFRGAVGTSGAGAGLACAAAVVPAWHALDSAAAGVWNLGVNTVAIPVAGLAWNTVAGVPLALLGQRPAAARVDGFWVTVVPAEEHGRALTADEVAQLGRWGLLLLKEDSPFNRELQRINTAAAEREAALQKQLIQARSDAQRERATLESRRRAALAGLAGTAPACGPGDVRLNEAELVRYLSAQGVAAADQRRIVELLGRHLGGPAAPIRAKTDPLQHSAEVVGETIEDAVSGQ